MSGEKEPEADSNLSGLPRQRSMPSDCRPIRAVNPKHGGTWDLYVRTKKIDQTKQKGAGACKELAFTVPEIVQNPSAVFLGVTELEFADEDWLCYAGVPGLAYDHKTGDSRPAWKAEVFLVFVDEDRIVRHWAWTVADPENLQLPLGHDQNRFNERLL